MTDTPTTREAMLATAQGELADISARLSTARSERDKLRDELKRVTAELNGRIAEQVAIVRDLAEQEGDAAGLVSSLTPRASRKAKAETHTLSGFGQSGTIETQGPDDGSDVA